MSSPAFSQADTKTPSDSLVLIPKQLVIYMLQDLVQADSDRVELDLASQQMQLQNELILKQSEMVTVLQNRVTILTQTYQTCQTDRDSLFVQHVALLKQNRRTTRAKRFWSSVAAVFGSLFVIKSL
jgi:hypothetical protein